MLPRPSRHIGQFLSRLAAAACLIAVNWPSWHSAAHSEEPAVKKPADADTDSRTAERKQLRRQMDDRAGKIKVAPADAPDKTAQLVAKPLMSYTDEPLSINGATLWAWVQTKEGRPIAICKVEHYDMTRRAVRAEWLYCFTSLAADRIHAAWPDGHEWTARRPGISFQEIPDAPRPGETQAARSRQLKDLARRFAASSEFGNGTHEELRLLTQPIYAYAEPKAGIVEGAVFATAANGTNPTALFLIELQREGDQQLWKFAVAAMTDAGVVVKWDGKEVWSKPAEHAPGKDFETWTYFFEKRDTVREDAGR
jgi:hypothetical protein